MPERTLAMRFIFFALLLLIVCLPASAQVPTIVVSGAGAPLVNGANLWNALAAVRSPDGLVKLEPGIYDMGTLSLVMRDGVDIEGSGRDNTTIRSTVGGVPVVFNPGIRSELREVRVENHSLNSVNQPAIRIASNSARVSRVDVSIDLGYQGVGIIIDVASPRLNDVDVFVQPRINDSVAGIFALGGAPTFENLKVVMKSGQATGIQRAVVLSDSAATIDGLTIVGSTDLGGTSTGLSVEEPSPSLVEAPVLAKVRDADIKVHTTGSGVQAFAVAVAHNHLELRDSKVEASSGASWIYSAGLAGSDDGQATVYGSTLLGTGAGGRGATSTAPAANTVLIVHHSVVDGVVATYDEQAGSISFGASQLVGPRPLLNATCANSYTNLYAVLNGAC